MVPQVRREPDVRAHVAAVGGRVAEQQDRAAPATARRRSTPDRQPSVGTNQTSRSPWPTERVRRRRSPGSVRGPRCRRRPVGGPCVPGEHVERGAGWCHLAAGRRRTSQQLRRPGGGLEPSAYRRPDVSVSARRNATNSSGREGATRARLGRGSRCSRRPEGRCRTPSPRPGSPYVASCGRFESTPQGDVSPCSG